MNILMITRKIDKGDGLSGFTYNSLWSLILFLLLVIVVGAGIYISCTVLFKMEEIKFVLSVFRRIKKS